MNTTAAATEAHVTVATIRTWARRGIIAATKVAGRWIIDTASLARRIAIGAMLRPAKPARLFTTDNMVAIGGSRWQRNGMDRVYINDWAGFAGLEVQTYGTGNISWAAWDGDKIANRQAGLFLGTIDKVWFDAADGKLHCRYGYSTPRIATREDIWEMTVDGIRAAITAL